MNENDGHDREVREYVRKRMAADMPPEFTRDVMSDVHRTPQRRRGFAWPMLATIAAATAVVVIGLGLINRPDVGSGPLPSASSSPSTAMPTPSGSADSTATPGGTVEPSSGEGEFGPIHSLAPEEAFANGQSCETGPLISNAEPTAYSYRMSFPEGWSTNQETTELRSACTLFAPVPFTASDDEAVPEAVAITTDVAPGGDFTIDNEILATDAFTVDGVPAARYEIAGADGGFSPEPSVYWIIGIGGSLPAVGNDEPFLAMWTTSDDPQELAEWADILDRMVATLDIGQ